MHVLEGCTAHLRSFNPVVGFGVLPGSLPLPFLATSHLRQPDTARNLAQQEQLLISWQQQKSWIHADCCMQKYILYSIDAIASRELTMSSGENCLQQGCHGSWGLVEFLPLLDFGLVFGGLQMHLSIIILMNWILNEIYRTHRKSEAAWYSLVLMTCAPLSSSSPASTGTTIHACSKRSLRVTSSGSIESLSSISGAEGSS